MNNFLSWYFWFSLNPGPWNQWGRVVLGLSLALVVLAVLFKLIIKIFKIRGVLARFFSKLTVWSLSVGFLNLLFWFFRDQRVPFFSARFWLLLVGILALVWLVFIFIFLFKKRPLEKQEQERAQEFDKYLPSRK